MKQKMRKVLAILAVFTLLLNGALPVVAEEAVCTENHDHSLHTKAPASEGHTHTEDCQHEVTESASSGEEAPQNESPEESTPLTDASEEQPVDNGGDEQEALLDDTGENDEGAPPIDSRDWPEGYEAYFSEERAFWLYHRPQDSPYDWDTFEGVLTMKHNCTVPL